MSVNGASDVTPYVVASRGFVVLCLFVVSFRTVIQRLQRWADRSQQAMLTHMYNNDTGVRCVWCELRVNTCDLCRAVWVVMRPTTHAHA